MEMLMMFNEILEPGDEWKEPEYKAFFVWGSPEELTKHYKTITDKDIEEEKLFHLEPIIISHKL